MGHFSSSDAIRRVHPAICLPLLELGERFVFFQVVCNTIPYCVLELRYLNHQAAILNLCFLGTSTLAPVCVGWLAQTHVESTKKLLSACLVLHLLGSSLLWALAFPWAEHPAGLPAEARGCLFHAALLVISLGSGGIRALACPPSACPAGAPEQTPGCTWRYWFKKLETTLVLLGISCLQDSASVSCLLLPVASGITAVLSLAIGNHEQTPQPEPPFGPAREIKSQRDVAAPLRFSGETGDLSPDFFLCSSPSSYTECAFSSVAPICDHRAPDPALNDGDRKAKEAAGPSGFLLQASSSDWSRGGRLLPVAALAALGSLPTAALSPVLDAARARAAPGGLLLWACSVGGTVAGALSLGVAGLVERRRKLFPTVRRQRLSGWAVVSSMPGAHLLPQYLLLGLVDALSCSAGSWFPATLDAGRLECCFFSLAGLTLLSLLGFWNLPLR
ncbi:solute carrier family 15 member 5 [Thomomys bottae]